MKLSLALTLANPLLAYAGCRYNINQSNNWQENGLWRVQIDITAWSENNHPDELNMLHNFCLKFYGT